MQRRDRFREPPRHDGLRRGAGVGRRSGKHLEQDTPETVDIAPPVELPAPRRLLRAHVGRRADRDPRLSQVLSGRRGDRARDPEVAHHRLSGL